MQLTTDDQWMMSYVTTRIKTWGDVRDGAARSMKKIQAHKDFIDWSDYFLPNQRKEEVKKALTAFKIAQTKNRKNRKPALEEHGQVPVFLDSHLAQQLVQQAKSEGCSVSDLLTRRLAS